MKPFKEKVGGESFGLLIGLLAFLIGIWGGLTIYSSQSSGGSPLLLASKQLGFLLFSLLVFRAVGAVPFAFLLRHWKTLAAAGLLLLMLVLGCGVKVNGMRGWFTAGPFYLQPSELLKCLFLLSLIRLDDLLPNRSRFFWAGSLFTGLWTAPILLQPDFGTACVYWAVWETVYFLCGGFWRYLLLPPVLGLIVGLQFILMKPYAMRRVAAFLDPESDLQGNGWHIRQFQLAIARGGISGEKLGNAVWSNSYLPFSYNDSAFAAMTETLGLFGALLLMTLFAALFALLLGRALSLPPEQRPERRFLAGACAMIALQLLLHGGVNTTLLPPTGITLPLVSYGGSSLLGTFLLLGLAVSASRSAARSR